MVVTISDHQDTVAARSIVGAEQEPSSTFEPSRFRWQGRPSEQHLPCMSTRSNDEEKRAQTSERPRATAEAIDDFLARRTQLVHLVSE